MHFVPERILRCRLVHTDRLYYMVFAEQSLPARSYRTQQEAVIDQIAAGSFSDDCLMHIHANVFCLIHGVLLSVGPEPTY